MRTLKILEYQLRDVLRTRWVVLYALFFLLATDMLFRFGGSGDRVILSLINVVLIVVPLVAVVLGAMHLYGARESIELLLSQPIERPALFLGIYAGFALPLAGAFVAGVTLPFLYHGAFTSGGASALPFLLLTGILLSVAFSALAFAIALATDDRIRGLGIGLVAWLLLALVWDGLVLMAVQTFAGYPVQRMVIGLSLLNPIDLGRILLLLQLDVSAMMGFTGAVFRNFFGSSTGQIVTSGALLAWVAVPFFVGRHMFGRKNF